MNNLKCSKYQLKKRPSNLFRIIILKTQLHSPRKPKPSTISWPFSKNYNWNPSMKASFQSRKTNRIRFLITLMYLYQLSFNFFLFIVNPKQLDYAWGVYKNDLGKLIRCFLVGFAPKFRQHGIHFPSQAHITSGQSKITISNLLTD